MGLFNKIFNRWAINAQMNNYFKTLTAYTPAFTTWGGKIYENSLVRSAIHTYATHCSKLSVEIQGSARPKLITALKHAPNSWQTWGQFLYRLATILEMQTTAFVVPILDDNDITTGIYSLLPSRCKLMEYNNTPYLRYEFKTGQYAAIELSRCGIMTKFQYEDDFFGAGNEALRQTMELIHIQNQGIAEGVKTSATYRFWASISNFTNNKDLEAERKRFTEGNLKTEDGGMLLFPNTYKDIHQIEAKPFVVSADQMQIINENVYTYFGTNKDILQNLAFGDKWSAYYEGKIEVFAIQFSEVLSKMLFTERELSNKARVMATANRLQYMSNKEKLEVSSQMADRGIMNRDEIREIWNLPPLPDGQGQAYTIRGEYYLLNQDGSVTKKGDDLTSGQ